MKKSEKKRGGGMAGHGAQSAISYIIIWSLVVGVGWMCGE